MGKIGLRNNFWPLKSGFLTPKRKKKCLFSKSSKFPILQLCWVISDIYSILKSLAEVMVDFIFLRITFSSHVANIE